MHLTFGRLGAALAWIVPVACAVPLAAQQNTAAPARAPQRVAAQPSGAQPSAGQPPAAQRPRAPSAYQPRPQQPTPRVRQAAAQEPAQNGQQPAGRAVVPGVAVPFTLTVQQQQLLDQILLQWERQSDRVKTFKCTFGRWKTNETFGPKEYDYALSIAQGYIKFKAPDHGIYKVTAMTEWDDQRKSHVPRTTGLDHWVCNGESIFEFEATKRQLIERPLSPEMRGKAIVDGPLPFVFGTKADQLKRRYWMRDVTPADEINHKIWLEAWPKFQQDAANFRQAIVILDQKKFMPEALRIILPDGKNKDDYKFENIQVNDPLSILKGDFLPPITPLGWTKVVEQAPSPGQVQPPGAADNAPRGPAVSRR
jgi:TIGR03009 family protein